MPQIYSDNFLPLYTDLVNLKRDLLSLKDTAAKGNISIHLAVIPCFIRLVQLRQQTEEFKTTSNRPSVLLTILLDEIDKCS